MKGGADSIQSKLKGPAQIIWKRLPNQIIAYGPTSRLYILSVQSIYLLWIRLLLIEPLSILLTDRVVNRF